MNDALGMWYVARGSSESRPFRIVAGERLRSMIALNVLASRMLCRQ